MDEQHPVPSPWVVPLVAGGVIATGDGLAIALLYRHLNFADPLRFAIWLWCSEAAIVALLGAAAGWALRGVARSRAGALGAGVCAAVALVAAVRLVWAVRTGSLGWWDTPTILLELGLVAGSGVAGVAAFLAARTSWARARGGSFLVLAFALVALGAFALRAEPPSTEPPDEGPPPARASGEDALGPNLLLVTVDTLRADHLIEYGYFRPTSTRLAELAAGGVLFERAISQRTNTAGSVATLLTGTYPPPHGVLNNRQILDESNVTLAEILRERGYRTHAVIGNPAVDPTVHFQQGFDAYEFPESIYDIPEDEPEESRRINVLALPALRSLASGRFFLWVHYKDPHTPYVVPEEYREMFTADEWASANGHYRVPVGEQTFGHVQAMAVLDGNTDQDHLIAQYDSEIRFVDESIAQLLGELEDLGLRDRTIVVFSADHGESLGEHDYYFAHGDLTFEPTAHVPLVFSQPGLPSGLRIPTPVSLVDFVPTVLDLLGLPAAVTVQGESIAPLVRGDGPPDGYRALHFILGSYRYGYQTHAVTDATHKLVLDVDERLLPVDALVERAADLWLGGAPAHPYRFRRLTTSLFDLAADPGELHDTSAVDRERAARLEGALWAWMDRTYLAGRDRPPVAAEISDRLKDALRALGY